MTAVQIPTTLPGLAPLGIHEIGRAESNELLTTWGHYLGPCNRPFGQQSFVLAVDGQPISLAVSASTVSATVAGGRYSRQQLVELARLCSAPDAAWATRPMLRLWREVCAHHWPHWPLQAAIAYSQNARHPGNIYRFDGWTKAAENCGSSGGGAWSRKRYATDAAHGAKTLWLWEYPEATA